MNQQIEFPLQETFVIREHHGKPFIAAGLEAARDGNPCIKIYGIGPIGERCKDCALLLRHETRSEKVFFKCRLRKITNGEATDHRANWPTCAKFSKATLI